MLYCLRGARRLTTVYKFGDFRLDGGTFELLRGNRPVKLERKPMELLVLIASRQGQVVTRPEIAERLWSSDVYVDTEHGINTAIRKLRLELRDDPAEPKFIRTVTGIGYCFVAPVTTEPMPQAEAAAPAIAAPPIAPESQELPVLRQRPRRFVWAVAGAAFAMLLLLAGLWLLKLHHRAAVPAIASLAVLPLDNFSGDSAQQYLADGMTDELITMLARNSTLPVTSRTSVMQYKGAHRPLSEIARSLGVDAIVEGSIARKGDQLHMTLQLIRADTDSHLWAQSFDRDISDTALATEAAQEIARQLHSATPDAKTQPSINPAAYDAYLHGKYLWMSDKMLDSGAYFRKATEIQPDYAAAWSGLANYYGAGVASDNLDPRRSLGPLEEAAKRAVQLGPNLAEAHESMAGAYLIARWDWADSEREVKRATEINPRGTTLNYFYACLLSAMNRKPEAIEAARKSIELAPYEEPTILAETYIFNRQFDEAVTELHLRLETVPNNLGLLFTLADTLRRKGDYAQSNEAWVKAMIAAGDPKSAAEGQKAFQRGGQIGFVQWLLAQREKRAKSEYVSPVELALYHAQFREKDQTLALLEEGLSQHATDMLWLQEDPAYDFLNSDAQYRSILSRVGRPPAPAH